MRQRTVQAIKRGTLPHRKGTFHFDPKGVPEARKRTVDDDVARALADAGLVKVLKTVTVDPSSPGPTVGEGAAERRDEASEHDGELSRFLGSTGSDTRDTTAFADDRTYGRRTPGPGVETDADDHGGDDGGDGDDDEGGDGSGDGDGAGGDGGDAGPDDGDEGGEGGEGGESGSEGGEGGGDAAALAAAAAARSAPPASRRGAGGRAAPAAERAPRSGNSNRTRGAKA